MAEPVISGLGRTGPWLQNAWTRVDTRLDDGSLSIVALAQAFRPMERALAFVRTAAGSTIAMVRSEYDVAPHDDVLGRGRQLTLTSRARGHTVRREIVLYDNQPFALTRVSLTNDGSTPAAIASLHPFSATGEGRARLGMYARPDDLRVYRHGWQSWSPTMSLGGAQSDLRSRTPDLAPERTLDGPGHFASDDVSVLDDPASGRSLLIGAVTSRDLLTQVVTDAPAKSIDTRCLADGVALAPGDTLASEWVLVDPCGGPTEQLERYGDALGRMMGARFPAVTPSGWCSWYYFFTGVTEDDVIRNLRFLEAHRRELPVQTVQIDDGYQADIGDWLTVNEKFPHGMAWLASEIKRAGYQPGIWLAPFLLAESSGTFASHPEFVVRDDGGEPVVACDNWQRKSYAIDGSHPAAQAWLTSLFREVCDGWGYDYVKIDFLYAAAVAGMRHDPHATRASAYRSALEAVRAGTGDDRFILGCGSLMAPSVGVFDGNRIGPDVAPFWRYLSSEDRAKPRPRFRTPDDPLSAETAIRNTMTRWWSHGRLWANDPDCVLVRTDRTKLTLDEVRTLATVVGLSGGMMLTSDDLDKLPPDRLEILAMLLPSLPASAVPADLMLRDIPERFEVVLDREGEPVHLRAVLNMDDDARDLVLAVPPGRWHAFELWEARYLGVVEGALDLALVPGHACRLIALRADRGVPCISGTDAHIGAGALDVRAEAFDPATAVLAATLQPLGRARRRVVVATSGRTTSDVTLNGAPVEFYTRAGSIVIDITIDRETEISVKFSGA